MTTTDKGTGLYSGAHPTAPGGMSEKALVEELTSRHGWNLSDAKALRWPEKIDAVAQGRITERAEAKAQQGQGMAEHDEAAVQHVSEIDFNEVAYPDDPFEFALQQPEQNHEPQPLFIGMPDTLDFIFDGHAGASPSGAERWMNCTASLGATRTFLETLSPNQREALAGSGVAARQGTTAHSAAEVEVGVMLGTVTPEEAEFTLLELAVMPETEGEAYDAEMAEFITEYVDLVRTYADAGHDLLVEQRVQAAVPLTGLHEGDYHLIPGSADFIALPTRAARVLTVGDLKYGSGVDVDVEHNPQVRIYALGALSEIADEEGNLPDIDRVDYYIVQPRLGGIKPWSESLDDLLTWRDEVLAPALTAALYGDDNLPAEQSTFSPSDETCQWCPVRGTCPALVEQRFEAAADLFDVVVAAEFNDGPGSFPETTTLTDTRLGELLAQIEGLVSIRDDLKAEAQRRLHRGDSVPGYKLVSYTPARKWTDDAVTALDPSTIDPDIISPEKAHLLWQRKLLTPKQAMGVLAVEGLDDPEAALAGLYEAPEKRPVIAADKDRRKTWEGRPPEQMFPEEEEA